MEIEKEWGAGEFEGFWTFFCGKKLKIKKFNNFNFSIIRYKPKISRR